MEHLECNLKALKQGPLHEGMCNKVSLQLLSLPLKLKVKLFNEICSVPQFGEKP